MQKEIEKRVLVERRLEYRRNIHIVEAMRGLIRAEIAKYLPTYLLSCRPREILGWQFVGYSIALDNALASKMEM